MEVIENWSLADVEAMIGAPWQPPSPDRPASRALYFKWINGQIGEATGQPCADQWLVPGGVPDHVDELQRETYDLRMQHSVAELRERAVHERERHG